MTRRSSRRLGERRRAALPLSGCTWISGIATVPLSRRLGERRRAALPLSGCTWISGIATVPLSRRLGERRRAALPLSGCTWISGIATVPLSRRLGERRRAALPLSRQLGISRNAARQMGGHVGMRVRAESRAGWPVRSLSRNDSALPHKALAAREARRNHRSHRGDGIDASSGSCQQVKVRGAWPPRPGERSRVVSSSANRGACRDSGGRHRRRRHNPPGAPRPGTAAGVRPHRSGDP
jgi:hypothetical protein